MRCSALSSYVGAEAWGVGGGWYTGGKQPVQEYLTPPCLTGGVNSERAVNCGSSPEGGSAWIQDVLDDYHGPCDRLVWNPRSPECLYELLGL